MLLVELVERIGNSGDMGDSPVHVGSTERLE